MPTDGPMGDAKPSKRTHIDFHSRKNGKQYFMISAAFDTAFVYEYKQLEFTLTKLYTRTHMETHKYFLQKFGSDKTPP